MLRVFAILREPASYTVDRNLNVYNKLGINYCYIKDKATAKSTIKDSDHLVLDHLSIAQRIAFIYKTLKNNNIIIINGYNGSEFIILYLLNLIFRRQIGIESDTQYQQPSNIIKRLIKYVYLSIVFKNRLYYGLAGGNFTHRDLFEKFGMDKSRILLMPMVVDNNKFIDERYRTKKIEPFTYIYVGRLVECKDIETMIKAFIKLRHENSMCRLIIVGTGILENRLKEKYHISGIEFAGSKFGSALKHCYEKSNVLILPSQKESWGLVVNEALSAGLPVIISDQVGARFDLVQNKKTGLIFECKNVEALMQCMKTISVESIYREYSDNAVKLMKDYWNYDLYLQCLTQFINNCNEHTKGH